jgi:Flp pilus assembly pilin Flp
MEGALSSTRNGARGQGLAEYALILSLIAIVVVAVLVFMGGDLKTLLSTIGKAI